MFAGLDFLGHGNLAESGLDCGWGWIGFSRGLILQFVAFSAPQN
jgi:hypothetical protein